MGATNRWFTVALPKGRLAEETTEFLKRAGLLGDGAVSDRQLLVEDEERRIRYVWLRPADALTYVERGVAAIGIVGKDVLVEAGAPVDELADLGIGRCHVALAVPLGSPFARFGADATRQLGMPLRVATHLPNLTRRYFEQRGQAVEIIYLRGSVEIAPRLGLADAIVDIVQTGRTLQANGLVPVDRILEVSSRLVAHPRARRAGDPRFADVTDALIAAATVAAGEEVTRR